MVTDTFSNKQTPLQWMILPDTKQEILGFLPSDTVLDLDVNLVLMYI